MSSIIGKTNSAQMFVRIFAIFAEFQHLRATALISPGTTLLVCPVDSLVNDTPFTTS